MKKSILVFTASAVMFSIALTSCNSPAEKVENAQEEVKDAKVDLVEANQEYLAEIDVYRIETAEKIAANEKSAAEFRARIKNDKKEAKAEYNEKIAKLEEKNSDMKKKLDDYKADGKENWQKFKTEFNHDMNEMGDAFRDLTVKNVK
jgi:predicted P-loop ATPase